jgi:oxygen-independent coproporphyrinogen III oxidase
MDAVKSNSIPKRTQKMGEVRRPTTDNLGIYISVPFCRAKCSYCNFASGVYGSDKMAAYLDSLLGEIRSARVRAEQWGANLPQFVDSVYFGGGTPSLLQIIHLQDILKAINDTVPRAPKMETTLECAPGQLEDELLDALPGLGFDRVSLGVQSFVDRETKAVGRMHTRAAALREISRLRGVGIDNVNVDLIAGLPHQTAESWSESVKQAIDSGVPHVSVYMLDVDEDSRLGREMLAGGTRYGVGLVPGEGLIAAMYAEACERFAAAGIAQYEISNFARPGYESRHNLKYWSRQPYLGFGLDAHSFLRTSGGGHVRIATTDNLDEYLNRGAREVETRVSETDAIEEMWFLGLRLTAGISLAKTEREIGPTAMAAFQPVLQQCVEEESLEYCDGNIRLTAHGKLFANDVFARFLGVLGAAELAEQSEITAEQGVFA